MGSTAVSMAPIGTCRRSITGWGTSSASSSTCCLRIRLVTSIDDSTVSSLAMWAASSGRRVSVLAGLGWSTLTRRATGLMVGLVAGLVVVWPVILSVGLTGAALSGACPWPCTRLVAKEAKAW